MRILLSALFLSWCAASALEAQDVAAAPAKRKTAVRRTVIAAPLAKRQTAPAKPWKFFPMFEFSSGELDGSDRNNLVYLPVSLKRLLPSADVSVTASYVSLETTGEATVVDGVMQQIYKGSSGTKAQSHSGLGDIEVLGRYYIVSQFDAVPTIDTYAKLKLPTADEKEGLGTGEFDLGFGFELSRWFADKYVVSLDWGYLVVGDPDNIKLNNQAVFDLGFGVNLEKQTLVSLFYKERTALVDGMDNPRDLQLKLNRRIDADKRFLAGFDIGLSDGSPDLGGYVGMSFKF
ncbi:MAG: transporter [Elusimicrobiota bacterium]